jgi:hypothetical protein
MMRAVLVVVVAIASGASALVATAATPCRSAAAAVSSPVVMSLSRRAALAAGALAAMPLGASAKTALEILSDDRAALAKDTEVVKALDDLLKKERKLAFDDEILVSAACPPRNWQQRRPHNRLSAFTDRQENGCVP